MGKLQEACRFSTLMIGQYRTLWVAIVDPRSEIEGDFSIIE